VVDLKTEGCGQPFDEDDPTKGHELQHPVAKPFSTMVQSHLEQELLDKHRLQLALYTIVLRFRRTAGADGRYETQPS